MTAKLPSSSWARTFHRDSSIAVVARWAATSAVLALILVAWGIPVRADEISVAFCVVGTVSHPFCASPSTGNWSNPRDWGLYNPESKVAQLIAEQEKQK